MPRNRKPRFGGPNDGRPQLNTSGATAETRPAPSGTGGDFRRKRAQQLAQRLQAVKGNKAATKRVQTKVDLNSKIDSLRAVEGRTEEQQAQLAALKERFSTVQAKSKKNPVPPGNMGKGMSVPNRFSKPAGGSHEGPKQNTGASDSLRERLDQKRFQYGGRGPTTRARRGPKRRGSSASASAAG